MEVNPRRPFRGDLRTEHPSAFRVSPTRTTSKTPETPRVTKAVHTLGDVLGSVDLQQEGYPPEGYAGRK